jgi:putative membrane-bound dehydrogenase-like protein
MTHPHMHSRRILTLIVAVATALSLKSAEPLRNPGPLAPRDEQATFRVPAGFRVELVASEPEVVDPVAMAFDERGRLFVAEMHGYPNEGFGTGNISSGRIRCLEDRNGDGVFETSTIFAEGLRFPTSVMPWRGGLLVANSPELIYLEDTKGTGKADRRRVLYTGFGIDNIQQLLNGLQWSIDNWVYACNGASGGTIRSVEKPDMPPVSLGNRGVRFHPEKPGSLEPMSGGGQYGLWPDSDGHWFTATNSQHLRQIVLPDHYLRRNPGLAVPVTTLDIPDHNPACAVFRISPFEAWRVERTGRRKGGPDAKRFAPTELVPGGFITSACSPLVYDAARFPEAFRGNVFVCEPANNLIHRDRLEPKGPVFVAKRADEGCEFLASTDNWFRPVSLAIGPEGGLYILDFYREVIETPRSLPDDMKPRLVLRSQGRGRIWRVVANDAPANPLRMPATMTSAELVPFLASDNSWWRLTAQRLLVEKNDPSIAEVATRLARESASPAGRAHAMWTLHALGRLDDETIAQALEHPAPTVRINALRLAEGRASESRLQGLVIKRANDPDPMVRFQAAFSLGECDSAAAVAALAGIARRDAADPWFASAVLSSAYRQPGQLLELLAADRDPASVTRPVLTRLASIIGARGSDADLIRAFAVLEGAPTARQIAILDGIGQGLQNSPRPMSRLWENPPDALRDPLKLARRFFERAAAVASDTSKPPADRIAAIRLLGQGPFDLAATTLRGMLAPQQMPELQLAAARALGGHNVPTVAKMLVDAWPTAGPALRRELQEALFARSDRLSALFDAIAAKRILPNQIDAVRIQQLHKLADPTQRERAKKLLAASVDADRLKVIEKHRATLDLKADLNRGRAVFRRICATCHRLEDVGTEVGPDLRAAVRDKTPEQLLISILDPSREVDRRFTTYLIETKSGRTVTGMIAAETANSLTLRRAEKQEEIVLRSQIESIEDTAKSLMPDGLEMQMSLQELADVILYLQRGG